MTSFRSSTLLALSAVTFVAAQGAYAAKPVLHHHRLGTEGESAEHYQDNGAKPAHTVADSTPFEARALMGKDGVTALDVRTGSFESSATPAGNITGVHVKAFAPSGKEQFDKQFPQLNGGGSASFSFPLSAGDAKTQLAHGQNLEIHALAKGLPSSNGTTEATLETSVVYRPQLLVRSLQVPPSAMVKTPVLIAADVYELLGDSGAHADCVLADGSTEIDRVSPIFVPNGGGTTCQFGVTFTTLGTHTLTVSVVNESPADYDPAPKTLTGTIVVKNPAQLTLTSVSFSDTGTSQTQTIDYFQANNGLKGGTPDQHSVQTSVTHDQTRTVFGSIPAALNFPLKKFSFTETMDGNQVSTVSIPDLDVSPSDPTDGYDSAASLAYFDNGVTLVMTRLANSSGLGVTTFRLDVKGKQVTTHFSGGFCKISPTFGCVNGDWTNPPDLTVNTGVSALPLGSTYGAAVTIDDGSAYDAHASFPLTALPPMPLGGGKVCMGSNPQKCVTTTNKTQTLTAGKIEQTAPASM